jgi:cytochrome d ubiquinol oxidase subunit I
LCVFAVLYTVLLVFALYFGSRIIAKGPNLTLEPPGLAAPVILPDRSGNV